MKFPGIHRILLVIYPKIHAGSPSLHELTLGENTGKEKAAIQWDDRCQKRLCTTTPIPAYVDFTQHFKLHTDACWSGLGAVLYQTHKDGTGTVIAYASGSLTKAESHYPTHMLEFLPLKWAEVKKFHKYLYGSTFNMYTDNTPWLTSLWWPSWMQPVTAGWPAWQTTTSGYTTEPERPI